MREETKMTDEGLARNRLKESRRVVVKVGTNLLLGDGVHPSPVQLQNVVSQISRLHEQNREVILVSSGAVGAGMKVLGIKTRPKTLPELQMAASVGQSYLMSEYSKLFSERKINIGQILLTHDDLRNRVRHLNARNTFLTLLKHRVIPIVNENDVVSVDEIRVGDNDVLASLVSMLVEANALVLATTADGFLESNSSSQKRLVSYIPKVTTEHLSHAVGKGSSLSTGGMATKLKAANNVTKVGGVAAIVNGRNDHNICDVLNGSLVGTVIGNKNSAKAKKRKQWIAFFNRIQGSIVVDDGAKGALLLHNRSLLPVGVLFTKGSFSVGSLVQIEDSSGTPIALGLSEYTSAEIEQIKGLSLSKAASLNELNSSSEVIHRDNIWIEE